MNTFSVNNLILFFNYSPSNDSSTESVFFDKSGGEEYRFFEPSAIERVSIFGEKVCYVSENENIFERYTTKWIKKLDKIKEILHLADNRETNIELFAIYCYSLFSTNESIFNKLKDFLSQVNKILGILLKCVELIKKTETCPSYETTELSLSDASDSTDLRLDSFYTTWFAFLDASTKKLYSEKIEETIQLFHFVSYNAYLYFLTYGRECEKLLNTLPLVLTEKYRGKVTWHILNEYARINIFQIFEIFRLVQLENRLNCFNKKNDDLNETLAANFYKLKTLSTFHVNEKKINLIRFVFTQLILSKQIVLNEFTDIIFKNLKYCSTDKISFEQPQYNVSLKLFSTNNINEHVFFHSEYMSFYNLLNNFYEHNFLQLFRNFHALLLLKLDKIFLEQNSQIYGTKDFLLKDLQEKLKFINDNQSKLKLEDLLRLQEMLNSARYDESILSMEKYSREILNMYNAVRTIP